MDKILAHKTILITGGSSQLGKAFTQKALSEGAHVLATYHSNKEELSSLKGEFLKTYQVDLANNDAVQEFINQIKAEHKELDILIHNAAAVRDHTIKNMSEEDWEAVLSADLKAPFLLTKGFYPLLSKRAQRARKEGVGRPKVFMITSRVALQGGFGVSNYAAAKAGLIGLTRSMAQELGKRKVLVNAINPGFMKSNMTKDLPEAVIQRNLEASPLEEWSNPEEVADFLVYLCSDKMSQVTGQVFNFESRKIS